MPSFDVTLNLPGFTIAKTSGFNPVIHDLDCHQTPRCPHCGGEDLRKKDKARRLVWHESVGLRRVLLRFAVCKFHCRCCGRYFRQRFEGILPYQRSTEAFKRQIYRLHTQGISRKSLAENCGRSDTTIARYYDHMYDLENRKLLTLQVPRVLGIDEHFFSRRKRFATTLCDRRKRRIFDVAAGRSRADLQSYLDALTAKNRVRVICMDLSETYRSIARTYFPRALVVADRFHVVRLALHHLMKTCRQIDPGLLHRRGPLRLLQKHGLQPWRTVGVLIYRGDEDTTWTLEIVDDAANSYVWDEQFASDQAAMEEFLASVESEGMKQHNPYYRRDLN